MEEKLLSTDDICEYISISRETFYKWMSSNSYRHIASVVSGNLKRKRLINALRDTLNGSRAEIKPDEIDKIELSKKKVCSTERKPDE